MWPNGHASLLAAAGIHSASLQIETLQQTAVNHVTIFSKYVVSSTGTRRYLHYLLALLLTSHVRAEKYEILSTTSLTNKYILTLTLIEVYHTTPAQRAVAHQ